MKASALIELGTALIQAREPFLVTGRPGVGKTSIGHTIADRLGMDMIVTHPVVKDPTDLKGLPWAGVVDGSPLATFLPYDDLRRMMTATRPTLVLVDDFGHATPAVQAAFMQLFLSRSIDGKPISDFVTFMCCTNRREDKAGVSGLITALVDRMVTVVQLDFDLDDFIRWGIKNGLPPVLLAFCRFKPDLMNTFDANRDMRKSATPRSVAGMGRLLNLGITNKEALDGAVGEGFSTEFLAFQRIWEELPSRDEIFLNPTTAPLPTRMDVLYALMGSLSHGVSSTTIAPLVQYLARLPQREFAVYCIKDALRNKPKLKATSAIVQFATDNSDIFGFDNE